MRHEREKGGHVLRGTTSRGLFVRVRPPHTSEHAGEGGVVSGGWRGIVCVALFY